MNILIIKYLLINYNIKLILFHLTYGTYHNLLTASSDFKGHIHLKRTPRMTQVSRYAFPKLAMKCISIPVFLSFNAQKAFC